MSAQHFVPQEAQPKTAVAEKAPSDVQMRLRRIEGQIRGIIRMLDEGKSCEDVVTQIFAARAGMDKVAAEVLKCHITETLVDKPPEEARESILRAVALLTRI
ncbi:MAG TPA: metal-sensitive transcriptional regulator [Ktedonobacterales bacterium]